MNAEDYFELARKLAQMRTEAAIRAAISRGYYAAFHFTKSLLEEFGFQLPKDTSAHDKIYYLLNNAGIQSAKDAAKFLFDLRRRRNLADYDFVQANMQTYQDCQFDLLQVIGIIEFCKNHSLEPLRSALKQGVSNYVQKVGL